ncbi:MAG: hypothetical protein OEX02_06695 [Cyclobacteriaceae bacterium]|nr:hypothetical protein [Cyclobacteriaceae bacterium]
MKSALYIVCAVLFFLNLNTYGQVVNSASSMDDLLQVFEDNKERGLEDANTLLEGYLKPLARGLNYGLSSGWVNTAEAHKTGGFDLTFTTALVRIPKRDYYFEALNLLELEVINPPDGNLPTFFGSHITPTFQHKSTGTQFDGVSGIGLENNDFLKSLPVPMVQLRVGVIKDTDLSFRYIPSLDMSPDRLSFRMFGAGIMHNIKQHIPVLKKAPFELAAFAGYNNVSFSTDLSSTLDGTQTGEFNIQTLSLMAMASKRITLLTVYGGVGTTVSRFNLKMLGQYDLNNDPTVFELEDPIDLKVNNLGPKATAGIMLKLAVITLHSDISFPLYNTFTFGFGISIR